MRAGGGLGSKLVAYLVSGGADPLMGPSNAGGVGVIRRALPTQGGHRFPWLSSRVLRCQSSSVKPSLEKQHLDCIPGLLNAQQCLPASQPPLVKGLGFGVGVGPHSESPAGGGSE